MLKETDKVSERGRKRRQRGLGLNIAFVFGVRKREEGR